MSDTPIAESPATLGSPTGFPTESPLDDKSKVKIDPSKDLWQNIASNVKDTSGEQLDQTVLIVGSRDSGKTSIIHRMLGQSTPVKPTTALEYSYGKREERNATQIAHFWELAQGSELSQLSDVVVTPESIHTVVLVIVVDCADATTMFETVNYWLKRIDRRVQEIFQKMRAKNSTTPEKMLAKARKRIGEDHPDISRMRISGIPTAIVANRLDLYKDNTVRLKTMVRTLRYISHLYGASLIFTSEQEREATKLRALLNSMIFQTPFDLKHLELDIEKGGVLLTAGRDSLTQIGDPAPTTPVGFKPCGDSELDRWKAPMDEAFPPKATQQAGHDAEFLAMLYDTAKGYGESTVDAMRKQKDEELEQYRRNASKRAAEKQDAA